MEIETCSDEGQLAPTQEVQGVSTLEAQESGRTVGSTTKARKQRRTSSPVDAASVVVFGLPPTNNKYTRHMSGNCTIVLECMRSYRVQKSADIERKNLKTKRIILNLYQEKQ